MSKEPQKLSLHLQLLRKNLGLPGQTTDTGVSEWEKSEAEKAYSRKVFEQQKPESLTFADLMNRVTAAKYQVDEWNGKIVKDLCLHFAGDPLSTLDPKKGIALLGPPGVGKTWLMKILRYNTHAPFSMVNCFSVADECEQGGSEGIARYFKMTKTGRHDLYYGHTEIGMCFNELGREAIPVKYFGNPHNIMEKIFFTRYETGVPHNMTHFTSNKTVDQMEALYGDYIRDRFREMFNVVAFKPETPSRR